MSEVAPNKIDHIGIAVKSIDDALPFYVDLLNMTLEKVEVVASEKVKVAFLTIGESRIELLEPTSNDSPIYSFIDKRGEGIHHIALHVTKIDDRLKKLKSKGVQLINERAKIGADNARIAFIHPKSASGVLYELCEKHQKEKRE